MAEVAILTEKDMSDIAILTEKEKLILQKKEQLLAIQERRKQYNEESEKLEKKLLKYEEENKILYFGHEDKGHLGKYGKWAPNGPQKKLIESFKNDEFLTYTYTGGNRSGKTFLLFIFALSCMRGHFPWEDPKVVGRWIWDLREWTPPIKIRVVGQDWEKHIKTVLIPRIKEVLPKSWDFVSRKNNVGVEAYWTDPLTNSTMEILSNNSESDLFEGWEGHMVAFDEPPKENNRTACTRGLVDYNGIEMYFMTLLKEAWVSQKVINATLKDGTPDMSVCNVHAKIYDNVGFGITQKGLDNFAKKLTDEQKETRLDGVPSYMQGLVLKINRNKHVIPRPKDGIPSHYVIDISIDIGLAKPHDILYIATAPNGTKYCCFEEQIIGDGTMIADSIIKKKNKYHLRINRVICDPLAKADKNNENSTWEKIDIGLNRFEMYLEAGAKDKGDGIIQINGLLESLHEIPYLYFFQDLARTIKQVTGWMYDDNGLPQKKDDDMCENLYRLILLDTMWEEQEEHYYEYAQGNDGRNKTTGY